MNAIVLAHESDFMLGPVRVRPATRSLIAGPVIEVVEPRVMQVLVVLAEAAGNVVARDDLAERCWHGRIVGDDAINRILSRLRRLADGIGRNAFVVETITRVGYRLRVIAGDEWDSRAVVAPREPALLLAGTGPFDRRMLLAGGATALAAIAGAWTMLGDRRAGPVQKIGSPGGIDPASDALMKQAGLALQQGTQDGQNQAIGLYRKVVEDHPTFADGWGSLALTYAHLGHCRTTEQVPALFRLAIAAGRRALSLDGANVPGRIAIANAQPLIGNWAKVEAVFRSALADRPSDEHALANLSDLLASTGRDRESAKLLDRLALVTPPTPIGLVDRACAYFKAGRAEDLEAVLAEGARLFPTHHAVWFLRFNALLFSGRPDAAIALAADPAARPSPRADDEIDAAVRVAKAMKSRAPGDIDAVIREQWQWARTASWMTEAAIVYSAALDRVDDAFAMLDGYYFNDGFTAGAPRSAGELASATPLNDRQTTLLFKPPMASVRADPRFGRLVSRLGLVDYWRTVKRRPDYLTVT